jgi:predicted ATPase
MSDSKPVGTEPTPDAAEAPVPHRAPAPHVPASIRTPDQLLRVFVSSTLRELAEERRAVRSAIERMRLAPVMFELGARPHPPRDLYRAYLQRSEIFLGIYAQRYGWVAPDETVSGLEDEYDLAPSGMPRLIYIKDTGEAPEPRLATLLKRIKSDDRVSYKSFETVEELRELVQADLATLLADRFDAARASLHGDLDQRTEERGVDGLRGDDGDAASATLPAPLTALVGREAEIDTISGLLTREGARLVTLVGSGGIGKSRLAIESGRLLRGSFRDGVVFVPLAAVTDEALVPATIAGALGVQDTGVEPIMDTLATALRNRRMLVIADNLEQVLGAASTITALLQAAPGLSFLVTSRTLLHVLGEQAVRVGPLPLPGSAHPTPAEALASPSVQLFVQRARSMRPDFEVTEENVEALVGVCQHLDGVPLALELAAASIRLLPPAALLQRLRQHRPLPGAARDVPSRQRTIEDTIAWSVQLLTDQERALLHHLGVFSGGFSLEAAESVAGDDADVLGDLGALVDASLVRQQDRGDRSRFTMLRSVLDFARRGLEESGRLDTARVSHTRYYVDRALSLAPDLKGRHQGATVLELAEERDDLRDAVRHLIEQREWDQLADLAWQLYVYWWIGGLLGEVRGWMEEMLASGDPLQDRSRAAGLYFTRAITFWQEEDERVVPGLTESAELFRGAAEPSGEALARISIALALLAGTPPEADRAEEELETALTLFRTAGDAWGEALALVTLGRSAMLGGRVQRALNRFEESVLLARRQGDTLSEAIAVHHLAWAHLLLGDADVAAPLFAESLRGSSRTGHSEGMAYGLEGLVAIAAVRGEVERAGRLLGASEVLRERTGLYNAPSFSFHRQMLAPILAGDAAAAFERARAAGRRISTPDAVAEALRPGAHSGGDGGGASGRADAAADPDADAAGRTSEPRDVDATGAAG